MSVNLSLSNPNQYHPRKGEVCYVPWRKAYWPALVKNWYPKKITYAFFPLAQEGKTICLTLCNPKKCLHLSCKDEPSEDKDEEFIDALEAAKEYIFNCGQEEGSECHTVDPLPFLVNGIRRPSALNPDTSGDNNNDGIEGDSEGSGNPEESEASQKRELPMDENDQPDSSGPKAKKMRQTSKKVRQTSGNTDDKDDARPTKQPASFASGASLKYNAAVPLNRIIFDNIDTFLSGLWEAAKVRSYKVPSRGDISVTLPYARILNENDADLLFEHCLNFVRVNEPECRTLPAIDLVSTVLFPEVILMSVMKERNISYDEAVQYMISYTSHPAEGFNNDPSTETPLHILVDAAIESKVEPKQDEQP